MAIQRLLAGRFAYQGFYLRFFPSLSSHCGSLHPETLVLEMVVSRLVLVIDTSILSISRTSIFDSVAMLLPSNIRVWLFLE